MPELGQGARRDAAARLEEAAGLAEAIGVAVEEKIHFRVRQPRPATLFGRGQVERIADAVRQAEAELLIVDAAISPVQQKNLEDETRAKVIDRTGLILEIFGERAATAEGRLQVELAHLDYQAGRLVRSWTHLERQRGGFGFLGGPGETQIEADRRLIRDRMAKLRRELDQVARTRSLHRARRRRAPWPVIALVGYTNAGKSTLFNALTQAKVLASPKMFATLDPTIRAVELPSRREILLSDTVGFIRNLPHTLVSAFRATLEEVQRAALVLQVSDASSPLSAEQDAQVELVLKELEADKKTRLWIRNKIDLLPAAQRDALRDDATNVHISAAKGIGFGTLLERIDAILQDDRLSRVHLRIPQKEGKALSMLQARARIYSREYKDGIVDLQAEGPESLLRRLKSFLVPD